MIKSKNLSKSKLSVCVFILLLTFITISCNSDNKRTTPITLTLWHYYNGTQLVAFDNLVKEFNESKGRELGIYVDAISHGSVSDLAVKVLKSASGTVGVDKLPDIFGAYGDTALIAKNMGLTVDLADYLSEEEIESYVESFINEGCFPPDNSYTIMPIAKSNELLFLDEKEWNRFVENSNLEVSFEDLTTWEGIIKICEYYYNYTDELTPAIPEDGKAFFGIDSIANYFLISLYQKGSPLAEYKNGELVFNLDKEIFREVWDLYFNAFINGYFGAVGKYRSDDVKTGHIAAYIGSKTGSRYFPNVITLTDGTQRDADLIVLPTPSFVDGIKAAVQQGAGMVVTKSETEREKAAVEFLTWFTEAERNAKFSIDSSYLPVKKIAYEKEFVDNILEQLDKEDDYTFSYEKRSILVSTNQLLTHESFSPAVYENSYNVRARIDIIDDTIAEIKKMVETDNLSETQIAEKSDEEFEKFYNDIVNLCNAQ